MTRGCASWVPLGVFALAFGSVLGCAGKAELSNTTTAVGKDGKLVRIDQPMRCDAKGKDKREIAIDLNQDGKADVRKVYAQGPEGEVLVCREADLNYDGVKDLIVMYDNLGRTIRDEIDLDKDGKIDIVSTYADGKVVKQEIDTNSDGLVDRVRFLEGEVPIRLEADTDGDRRIDYWEYYEDGKLVRIGMDKDGDGKAEEWARDDIAAARTEKNTDETPEVDESPGDGGTAEPGAKAQDSASDKSKAKAKTE